MALEISRISCIWIVSISVSGQTGYLAQLYYRLELDAGLDDSEFDEDGIIIQPHKGWQSTEKIRKTKVKYFLNSLLVDI